MGDESLPPANAAHLHVKTLWLTAMDLDAVARPAWLADLERRDPAVGAEVRRLLDAHQRADAFLDLPDDDDADAEPRLPPGFAIGPFVVERELGRGGMGTVYLGARSDHGFVQRVAIKVLGTNVAADAVARLRDERRILAALSHPGIAHFVDGGATADGLPYLAMEYVPGQPVTTYCDEARLDQPARLRLFLKVCAAVHFAHQHLVVHRDLKPSNILVTGDGAPKLLDFGIAKLLDAAGGGPSSTVQVLTPRYASPEQATGDQVTTATDVYSLGVLLYELLTGTGPYSTVMPDASPLAVLDAVRSAEPERPSVGAAGRKRPAVDGDLDAIVLKALRKVPADRYGSAEQFGDDVKRYLDHQPVLARHGSAWYGARKFITRHRAGVAAGAVAAVSLTLAAGVSIRQSRVADTQRARAEARFNDGRKLANSFVFEFDEAVRDIPGTTAARKLVIARSLGYLEELARDAQGDVPLQRELAATYQRIGDVQGNPYLPNLGERPEALDSYRHALGLREAVASRPDATDADSAALGAALLATGDLLWGDGDFAGALQHYTRATSINRALWDERAGDSALAYATATSIYSVGQALVKLGRFAEAREAYRRAAETNRDSPLPRHRRFTAVAEMKVGDAQLREGLASAAATTYRRSAAEFAGLVARDPGSATMRRTEAFALHRVALAEAAQGHVDEAYAMASRALAAQQLLSSADPGDRQIQGDEALSLSTLSGLDLVAGRVADARARVTRSLAVYDASAAAGARYIDLRSDHAVALRRFGDVLDRSGERAEALARYQEAAAMLEQAPVDAEYAPEMVVTCLRAYWLLRRAATATDAERWLTRARTEWARTSAAGVHTWMMEFGGASRLADALVAAGATDAVGPSR